MGTAYGLAPMQAGMLFQALLGADAFAAGYNVEQLRMSLSERLEPEVFGQAFREVANRHPILASSFAWEGVEQPEQRVQGDVTVPLEVVSLEGLDAATIEHRLEAFLREDRQRGFDLRVAPAMRITVFPISGDRTEVVWTFHHILLDGRSFALVLREVFDAYEALRLGEPVRFGPAPRPYRDYVAWVSALDPKASEAFFRELLKGKRTPTPLPCAEPVGRPLPADGYGEIGRVAGQALQTALRELASRTETTVGTVIQAAWALVLGRFTGETDVLFGGTRACRRSALDGAAQSMVGLFINTLPVRARIDDERTVSELLKDLRAQSIALREHEHTPLVDIQKHSEIPSGTQLFDTLLMFENQTLTDTLRASDDPRWQGRSFVLHEQPSPALNVTVFDATELEVRILFDRRRFRDVVIERLIGSLLVTIEDFARGEQRPLREIDVLPPHERQKILFEWNDTARPFPDTLGIHEPFEARVALQPDQVAVEMDGASLTYAELEARANRLAHLLRARGARPGTYVGICVRRSLELVVALLGVAKSGSPYVPLDPTYPPERLTFMLEDTGAPVVVTAGDTAALFPGRALVLDGADAAELARMPEHRPERSSAPEDACYTIFTSGSTGKPKGVVLSHRAVVNTFDWVSRTFEVGPGDRLLFVTSPCFDLSVYDTFGALGAGATVVVASEALLADPAALASAVVERKITIWDSAPAALQRLVTFFPEDTHDSPLRLVMLSGDWIPLSLPDAMRSRFKLARVMSLGGATEAAIWSNWYPIGELDPRWVSVPYGKPIQNARYHVLDHRMQPVPVGVPGDLYIGGTCVAEGYLNRKELTEERFLRDPFANTGERLYKTGDLARYFDDGNLEFLGRSDFQVKIRGFRVEMGEVEAAVCALPGVREAACAAYMDASGQKSLVAYVVVEPGISIDDRGVKDGVGRALPDFMVPSHVVFLDAMPVSSNGKLDRKALPSPTARSTKDAFVAPSTPTEQELALIWEQLLDRHPIGATDNFFQLGGHSLLAVMLVSRIHKRFGTEVQLARLIERPTIQALAQLLDGAASLARTSTHIQTFHRDGKRPPLVLIPGLIGTVFTYRALPRLLGSDQPVHVIDLLNAKGRHAAFGTIEEMAEIYEPEILPLIGNGPVILGGFSFGALAAFELARRLRQRGHEVPLLISFDGFAPGYPEKLPMPERLVAHAREFAEGDAAARKAYLSERMAGIRARFKKLLRRKEELVPAMNVPDPELAMHIRRMSAAQRQAQSNYVPTESLDVSLLLLRAEIPLRWVATKMDDALHGWRRFVKGPISLVTVPGSHLRLFDDENQPLLAKAIEDHIDRLIDDAPNSTSQPLR